MDKDRIDEIVALIMINDGPDGHCDGSEIIANFVIAVCDGDGEKWAKKYMEENNIKE